MEFVGAKFYPKGEVKIRDESRWYEEVYITKTTFGVTSTYKEFLAAKAAKEREEELMILRAKLEYQQKTYGEVDPIDLQEFLAKI